MQDAFNNLIGNDSSTITLSIASSPGNASLGGTLTATAANGQAGFSGIYGNIAGNYTLAVADGNLAGATSNAFTVLPGKASQLVIATQPGNTTAGNAIANFNVSVEDIFSNVVTTDTST